jgi:hypothetical protein
MSGKRVAIFAKLTLCASHIPARRQGPERRENERTGEIMGGRNGLSRKRHTENVFG